MIGLMSWNIIGWFGMGLLDIHTQSQSKGTHCEVTFCFCKVEDGNKICTCHHPELHAKQETAHSDDHHNQTVDDPKTEKSYCYYSASHEVPANKDTLIIWAKFNTIFTPASVRFSIPERSAQILLDTEYLTSGFTQELLRPPMI